LVRRQQMRNLFFAFLALFTIAVSSHSWAESTEKRIALVIGNGNYQSGALPTPANDAGLIAQTLQAAGFDVVGARDLDEDPLRHAFRDFYAGVAGSVYWRRGALQRRRPRSVPLRPHGALPPCRARCSCTAPACGRVALPRFSAAGGRA